MAVRYWPKADMSLCNCTCPLLRVKQTWLFALHMSAYDPKRTLTSLPRQSILPLRCRLLHRRNMKSF
jgi:hypothetical protein